MSEIDLTFVLFMCDPHKYPNNTLENGFNLHRIINLLRILLLIGLRDSR